MANRERGEFDIAIGAATYTLVLNTNAMALLEDHFSTRDKEVTFDQVIARVNAGSVRHIRALVWAALQQHHPTVTIPEAGTLIQEAGGLAGFTQQLLAMMKGTHADPDDLAALGVKPDTGNPRQAQAGARGTGRHSSATRGASV
jgi:hypothetical protein